MVASTNEVMGRNLDSRGASGGRVGGGTCGRACWPSAHESLREGGGPSPPRARGSAGKSRLRVGLVALGSAQFPHQGSGGWSIQPMAGVVPSCHPRSV